MEKDKMRTNPVLLCAVFLVVSVYSFLIGFYIGDLMNDQLHRHKFYKYRVPIEAVEQKSEAICL